MSVVVVWDAALYGFPGRVCCFDLNENEDPPPFRLVLLLVVSPFSIPSLEDEAFRRCISTIFLALEAMKMRGQVGVVLCFLLIAYCLWGLGVGGCARGGGREKRYLHEEYHKYCTKVWYR